MERPAEQVDALAQAEHVQDRMLAAMVDSTHDAAHDRRGGDTWISKSFGASRRPP
jgi:hypothetical protein